MKSVVILVGLTLVLKCSEARRNTGSGLCKDLTAPLFGSIKMKSPTKVQFSCEKDFSLIGGRSTRLCRKTKRAGFNYAWSGRPLRCYPTARLGARKCVRISDPTNGKVYVFSYSNGSIATFTCNQGHVLVGDSPITCGSGYRWNKDYPSCQQARKSARDFANTLKDKFIDEYAVASVDSKDGIQAKLSAGKSGLDLVFAIDTSASIGQQSLENGKKFVQVICEKFGISNDTTGGNDGTRIALITFSDKAKVVFNLNDENVRDMETVIEKIKGIKTEGGGTNFIRLFETIRSKVYLKNFGDRKADNEEHIRERRDNANRAIFIITDAENPFEVGEDKKMLKDRLILIANVIRRVNKFEVFAIGVGTKIQKSFLAEIASPPFYEHVFEIKNFEDLKTIGDIIAEDNIDYGKCGISGNTEISASQDGVAQKGAWPWLGWIGVFQNPKSMISCGGALLCDKWFVTLANCVTENTDEGITTLEQRINVYLGDQDNLMSDPTEMMVAVKQVHVHPNYTGEKNEYGVIPFDIALLELGEDNTTIPKLNKFIRPLCFLESRDTPNYAVGRTMLSILKSQNQQQKAQIAGWGHMGNQQIFKPEVYPWQKLKQVDRSLQTDNICKRRYPNLDTDMYICVGLVHEPDMETCYGDIGGPLMSLMSIKRYTFLGLALKTKECTKLYEFSLFLNILHPDINVWIQKQLRGCNRINEPNPYVDEVEEPVDADNKTEAGRENHKDGVDSKNGDGDQGRKLIADADAEKEEDDKRNVGNKVKNIGQDNALPEADDNRNEGEDLEVGEPVDAESKAEAGRENGEDDEGGMHDDKKEVNDGDNVKDGVANNDDANADEDSSDNNVHVIEIEDMIVVE